MRSTSFVAIALCAFSTSVLAAPTPQLSNIIGSITNPGAGNDNDFLGNLNGNGNKNGNGNEAGNKNGNGNEAGNKNGNGNSADGNQIGSGNGFSFGKRVAKASWTKEDQDRIDNIIGSVTNPTAGSGNEFKDNLDQNGNGNGNGNSAGNGNGNGNSAGNGNGNGNSADGNQIGSGNDFSVSPVTELPDVTLPGALLPPVNIEMPDVNLSPTIK